MIVLRSGRRGELSRQKRLFPGSCLAPLLTALTAPHVAASERVPLFSHVTAPHSYYWREMYVPQLTSGPSSVAWAPDGKGLYYSMQGRIWKQVLDDAFAEQITTGAGYEYQPDVSPDGRTLVFARRLKDAIELVARDLKSGRETQLTDSGALNLDARWSPDGKHIAYVTTAESGNFHIAIAERGKDGWVSRRWRPERKTAAPRYYYSQVDHELSPDWSPDGTELVFVANPDILHGTGSIFRQKVDLSAPAVLIHEEETNWKARPDWSPDGTRILYSSYLGRQWHQLWMTTAESGGYPMPFSYGDFDGTSARWSPDGTKIAYISNQADLEIEVIEVMGGARRTVGAPPYSPGTGALSFQMANQAIPVRMRVEGSDGRDYAPIESLIHGDDGRDPTTPTEARYFHSAGSFVELPPGRATVKTWHGLSALPTTMTVDIALRHVTETLIKALPIDTAPFANWKSGDVHVHMNYGGAYRMTKKRLAFQADAEALDLVFNLIVNKEQRIPDIGEFGGIPVRPESGAVIAQGQEFHTSVWGHLGFLGQKSHILIPDYAGYPKTAAASLYPDNATVAALARKQGALIGYVHPFDPPAPDPANDAKLTHSLPADVALGLVDYVEIVGFSDHRTTEAVWHRLLNCGFRIPAAGGTDAMTNYASLRGPVGMNRTYVDLGPNPPEDAAAFTRAWLDGLKAGKTFATNSALLSVTVEGQGPGAELKLANGAHKLKFAVRMASIAAIDSLDLIVNGEVVQKLPLDSDGMSAVAAGEIDIDKSSWITLRASSKEASPDVFDLYPFAVTSPIYVTVGGKPQRSRADADYFIAWIDRLIAFARKGAAFNTDAERAIVVENFEKARREFARRR